MNLPLIDSTEYLPLDPYQKLDPPALCHLLLSKHLVVRKKMFMKDSLKDCGSFILLGTVIQRAVIECLVLSWWWNSE